MEDLIIKLTGLEFLTAPQKIFHPTMMEYL